MPRHVYVASDSLTVEAVFLRRRDVHVVSMVAAAAASHGRGGAAQASAHDLTHSSLAAHGVLAGVGARGVGRVRRTRSERALDAADRHLSADRAAPASARRR